MRQVIASINLTIDGFCDHTAMTGADAELHDHYTNLLRNAGTLVYGRITYQLMENYWPALVESPSGDKSMDDFAQAIHDVDKVVFSRTLKQVTWKNTTLAKKSLAEEISELRKQSGKDIFLGSPSMIDALTRLKLIDEYQLCIHPVVLGNGLPLFKNISEQVNLELKNTKTFTSGVVAHYYRAIRK